MSTLLRVCILFLAMLPAMSFADSLLPIIPKAKGGECVGSTQDMRINHMDYILHQRDETMRRGIRTRQHSLKECINCHVQAKADGSYPDIKSQEHFCNSCHDYAAVSVDCFQCHSTKPESASGISTSSTGAPHGH